MGFPQFFYNLRDHCQTYGNHLRPLGLHRNREDGRKGRFSIYEGGVAVRWRQLWQQSCSRKGLEVEEAARIPREGAGGLSYIVYVVTMCFGGIPKFSPDCSVSS